MQAFFLFSCNADILQDGESVYSDETVSCPTTWQSQLQYARNSNNVTTRSGANGLYFVGYTYKGKINTKTQKFELLEQLFADDTDIVAYLDRLNFEIVPLKIIRQKAQSMAVNDPSETLKLQLDSVVKIGMDIIGLEWRYKGKTFYSTAIASNEQGGILYDHIGHMAVVSDSHKSQVSQIKSGVRVKTRREVDGTTERSFVLQDNGGYNSFGKAVWEYTISCSSFFDGNGILRNRSMVALHDAVFGWSCDAQVKTINGDIGSSKFHEFAWGHTHAFFLTVSLEWGGAGFTISGGGSGSTGSVVHSR